MHLGAPLRWTLRVGPPQVRPLRKRGQQRVGLAQAMRPITRPGITVQVRDHPGPQRIGLDVPQDGPEVRVLLDDWAFEPPLPDVPDRAMAPVIPPGVRHTERLQHAADRDTRFGSQEQVEVVGQQTVAEEAEWIAQLCLGQGVEKGMVVHRVEEDGLAVVAAVEGVIGQALGDRSWQASHGETVPGSSRPGLKKDNDPTDG